jgi:hypothetical protein
VHDANPIQFSIGRDLILAPPQGRAALNYLIYAYIEVDGKLFPSVNKKFTFRDVNAAPESVGEMR